MFYILNEFVFYFKIKTLTNAYSIPASYNPTHHTEIVFYDTNDFKRRPASVL